VGCGAGGTLEELARRWPDAHFDGVNLNPGQLHLAARALAGRANVRLLAGDVLEVPADGSYDLIYCLESAFHIADKSRLLRRFAALAAPGAELCLVDVFPTRRLQRSLERRGSARSGIFSYLNVEAWSELSGRCGFRVTGWEELSRQVANSIVIRTPLADFLGRMKTALARRRNPEALLRRAREVYFGYRKLHRMLSRGLAHYGILRARRLAR
jgi:cyclopropane fatty-acyl-phospholipid synthase-like methyltransferase